MPIDVTSNNRIVVSELKFVIFGIINDSLNFILTIPSSFIANLLHPGPGFYWVVKLSISTSTSWIITIGLGTTKVIIYLLTPGEILLLSVS